MQNRDNTVDIILLHFIKGIVHSKMKVLSLSTHTYVVPNTVRPWFIFGTQIKIFLMKSESFLTLHRQQRNWHI